MHEKAVKTSSTNAEKEEEETKLLLLDKQAKLKQDFEKKQKKLRT